MHQAAAAATHKLLPPPPLKHTATGRPRVRHHVRNTARSNPHQAHHAARGLIPGRSRQEAASGAAGAWSRQHHSEIRAGAWDLWCVLCAATGCFGGASGGWQQQPGKGKCTYIRPFSRAGQPLCASSACKQPVEKAPRVPISPDSQQRQLAGNNHSPHSALFSNVNTNTRTRQHTYTNICTPP